MTMPGYMPPGAVPPSPFAARNGLVRAPSEDDFSRLTRRFAAAPPHIAHMMADWVRISRPKWSVDDVETTPVFIGNRLEELGPSQSLSLTIGIPYITAFYGLAIVTRDRETDELVWSNTDILFQYTDKHGKYLAGSNGHMCPVAPFDPSGGKGYSLLPGWIMGDTDKLKVTFKNESKSRSYAVVVSVQGLGMSERGSG